MVRITGHPSSGRDRIARLALEMLRTEGYRTEILVVGETPVDSSHIGLISKLLIKNGVIVLVTEDLSANEGLDKILVRCSAEVGLQGINVEPSRWDLLLDSENHTILECAHLLTKVIRGKGCLKQNLNEFRVFGMRRSGHHGVVAWLLRHFDGEMYYYNNVSAWREHFSISGKKDDQSYNVGLSDVRDCYLFNVEDAELPGLPLKISSDEWLTDSGPSGRVHQILVLRDPYNLLASRIRMFGEDTATRLKTLKLWKEYAREFLGLSSYLPADTIKVSYNAWHSSREYRIMLSQRMGLRFSDRGLDDMIVPSSFDQMAIKPRTMDVLARWRHYAQDAEYRELFIADDETNALAEGVFGAAARAIRDEIVDGADSNIECPYAT